LTKVRSILFTMILSRFWNNKFHPIVAAISSLSGTILAEQAYEGKAIDPPKTYVDTICNVVLPVSEVEEGLRAMRDMQPWQKKMISPSREFFEDNTEPPDSLQLEFVFGYTHDVTRRNAQYLGGVVYAASLSGNSGTNNSVKLLTNTTSNNNVNNKGEIVFFATNLGVVMNPVTRVQRFYTAHTAKISSLAVNRTHGVVATGEITKLPTIHIWNPQTLITLSIFGGFHKRGVTHLRFSSETSNNAKYLLALGADEYHSLAVYDWQRSTLLFTTPTFAQKCYDIDFAPTANVNANRNTNGSLQIVQCGQEIIRFWTILGKNASFEDGVLSSRSKVQSFLSLAFLGSHAVVGTLDGSIYRFLGNKLESMVPAHSGPVHALCSASSEGLLSVAADGCCKLWTRFLECRLVIETRSVHAISNILRCCDWDVDRGRILFGTAASELFEVSAADGENSHKGSILEGHGGDSLWGLAVNPTKEDEFCTVGDDALLRVWSSATHSSLQSMQLELPSRCVAYSPDGKQIAVGCGSPHKVSGW
jgi:WD40 repeat protein